MIRNPRNCASVWYQMLLGNWGSCIFQERSEPRRAELRNMFGSSCHEPPRTECGYGFVAFSQGSVTHSAADLAYSSGRYWSSVHSATFPYMSYSPHGFGFFWPTFWYLPSLLSEYHAYSPNLETSLPNE